MKFSTNWIRECVEGLDTPPKELGLLITMKTAEHEGVELVGAALDAACAARVLSVELIEGSKNRKAEVETGRYGSKTVVCGAANCRPGMLTAYVPVGAELQGKTIAKAVIGGVESDGMLASGAELGLNRDVDGIVDLGGGEPGAPIARCLPDAVIEIDNKSLTHRPDLWGHYGMAREVAAITGRKLIDPVKMDLLPSGEAAVKVDIENPGLCPRYSALVLENVTVQPSPLWLQYRLESIGLNPINNIVDVTNFVMAELAQPLHAFDHDKLNGDTIFVRRARAGERVTGLNGEEYALDGDAIVIADNGGAIAIGGVIGGLDSGITARTRRVVLESANFLGSNIRRTSSRLKLRTDASMRFEKAQDPLNTTRGLARALELLLEVSPGIRVVGGVADAGRPLKDAPEIELPLDWLERKLGHAVAPGQVRAILESIEFGVRESRPGVLHVKVPSWRATKDVSIKDDLVEEVGRMVGYGAITPQPPAIPSTVPPASPERVYHHEVRAMAAAQGFTEVYNYSFVSQEQAAELGMDPAAHLKVLNPIAADLSMMRTSLLPGILKNVRGNCRHLPNFQFFETGYEILKQAEGLPDEVPHLAAAVYAREGDGRPGLFEVKRLAECLLPGLAVEAAAPRPYEHPARSYAIHWRGERLGRIFELHPNLVEGRAAVLDIDLAAAFRLQPAVEKYKPLRRFPSSAFDLSVLAGLREHVAGLSRRLAELAGADLESIDFVRQYTGPPLPEDRQSVSFRLTVASDTHTLSNEGIAAIRSRIIDGMRAAGYELRV